jgi:hypothetical protein
MNFLLYCVLSLIGINQVLAGTTAPIVSTLKPNFKTDTITTINIDFCVSYVDRENGEDNVGAAYELIS